MRLALIKLIYIVITLFALAAMLFSCSPSVRVAKIIKKHPELGKTKSKDTLIVTKGSKIDTVFIHTKDTVIIHKGKETIKYFYNTKDSTVYLQGNCDGDSIKVKRSETNFEVSEKSKFDSLLEKAFWIIIIIMIAKTVLTHFEKK